MIRRFLGKMFSGRLFRSSGPDVIPFAKHHIERSLVSRNATRICESLQHAGHNAFVVGGAVRDLLLGRKPKDFDIATSAKPEEVRTLFRRSRIIGRRFRLVHVIFGPETIEVATFRGAADPDAAVPGDVDEHGRILRDNVFGSQEEDARRRDFTVNAMFYDPVREEVLDYHNGFADARAHRLRMIGEAELRYREDPMRMLRAVRFAASRGLEIDARTRRPIRALADLLQNVPQARVFDEMMKMLFSGHAVECVRRLRKEGLHHGVLPLLDVILEQPLGERFVMAALAATDERLNAGQPVSPAFLFAALLWHEVLATWRQIEAAGTLPIPALYAAMDKVLAVQAAKLAIPRRYGSDMKEIWALQPRFANRSGRRPYQLLAHQRFRAAYDFLGLRTASGEIDRELSDWWVLFQSADDAGRAAMLAKDGVGPKRRRRRKRKPAAGPKEVAA
jgi:poly(A) polymerase